MVIVFVAAVVHKKKMIMFDFQVAEWTSDLRVSFFSRGQLADCFADKYLIIYHFAILSRDGLINDSVKSFSVALRRCQDVRRRIAHMYPCITKITLVAVVRLHFFQCARISGC